MWRVIWSVGRWRWMLRNVERIPVGEDDPRPTFASDGVHGAKLYRRNMPRRALRPRIDAVAHVPVQLVVPSGDRFISPSYYERAEQFAKTMVDGHDPVERRRDIRAERGRHEPVLTSEPFFMTYSLTGVRSSSSLASARTIELRLLRTSSEAIARA